MKDKSERFLIENKKLVDDLCNELSKAIKSIDSVGTISAVKGERIVALLDDYISAIHMSKEEAVSIIKTIDTLKIAFDEKKVLKELDSLGDGIELLAKVAREKIIGASSDDFKSDSGKRLIENGYLQLIELKGNSSQYYALSKKGIKSIKTKSVQDVMRSKSNAGVIPASIVPAVDDWGNLYCKRLERIHRYFNRTKKGTEYFTFLAFKDSEMVFACEVSDSVDVSYVFSGIFDDYSMSKDIGQIVDILGSGLVDEIKILVESEDEKEKLIANGLDPNEMKHLTFDVIGQLEV